MWEGAESLKSLNQRSKVKFKIKKNVNINSREK